MANSTSFQSKAQILAQAEQIGKDIEALYWDMNASINALSTASQRATKAAQENAIGMMSTVAGLGTLANACSNGISSCRTSLSTLLKYGRTLYSSFSSGLSEIENAENDISKSFGEVSFKLAKKAGTIGGVIGAADGVINAINGMGGSSYLKNAANWMSAGNSTFKAGKKMYGATKGLRKFAPLLKGRSLSDKVDIVGKKLIGGQDYFYVNKLGAASKASSASTRWYNNYQKVKGNELSNLKKGSFWVGTAISGVVNAADNYDEHGGFTGRGIAETVTETVIDVGVDVALTTVAATALACTPIGAPVVLVAGVTTLVKWGADELCESLTGKDFTEWASDGIIDGATKAYEVISEGAKDLYDGAKDAYNKVADAATNCFNKVADGVSAGWKKLFG